MDFLGIGQKRDWKENNHKQKCKVKQSMLERLNDADETFWSTMNLKQLEMEMKRQPSKNLAKHIKKRQDNKKDDGKSPKKYVLQNLLVKKEWNGRLVTKRKWNESKGRYLVYFCDEQNTKVWVKRENLKEDD